MIKKLIRKIVLGETAARVLIKPVLRCHSLCYKLAGQYGIILNGGIHPKHRILKYKEWFLSNIESGWTILDIGCNTGMLPSLLSEKAAFVYGIEINPELIATARADHSKSNIEYICADATAYDYTTCRPIDCVTMSNVLEHIGRRAEFLQKIIKQINWADAQHKRFLFRVPAIDREWIVLYKKELGVDYKLAPDHEIEYTLESFGKELAVAGIRIDHAETRFGEIYALCNVV